MKCTNCGAKLTCGCKKRIAKDGAKVCAHCVKAYNARLKAIEENKKE